MLSKTTQRAGPEVAITISDQDAGTLNKFKQKRIKADDAVRVKFIVKKGKTRRRFSKERGMLTDSCIQTDRSNGPKVCEIGMALHVLQTVDQD